MTAGMGRVDGPEGDALSMHSVSFIRLGGDG